MQTLLVFFLILIGIQGLVENENVSVAYKF